MALLNRFSKLNDRGETGIFTFIVTKSVTRDFHRDATTKDFCFGYHRWAISFQRPTEKVLGVHLLLRNPTPSTACVVDFTLTLLNREHFSQNEVYTKRQAKFTITNPMQGVSRWIQMSDLIDRHFSNETGEFLFELSLSNMTTVFECDIQLNPSTLTQYKTMLKDGMNPQQTSQPQTSASASDSPGNKQGSTNSGSKLQQQTATQSTELINLETNYFTFGAFDWSLTIVPLVIPNQQQQQQQQQTQQNATDPAAGTKLLTPNELHSSSNLSISSSNNSLNQQQISVNLDNKKSVQHQRLEPVCRVYLNRLNGFDCLCRVKYRVILGHHQQGGHQAVEFVDSKVLDQISDTGGRIRGHQFRNTNILKLITFKSSSSAAASASASANTAAQQHLSTINQQQALQAQMMQTYHKNSSYHHSSHHHSSSHHHHHHSGATSLDLRVHIEMFCANTISEAKVPLQRKPNEAQVSNCCDRNKQAWCVESDSENENVRLKLFFMDLQSVPRNHIRYISWIAYVVKRDSKSGAMKESIAVRNSPHSNYYLQDGIDMGTIMDTHIPVKELDNSPKAYLDGNQLTVHIEWVDSLLLFSHLYNNYDSLATIQRHQIRRELYALQAEFTHLEKKHINTRKALNQLLEQTGRHQRIGLHNNSSTNNEEEEALDLDGDNEDDDYTPDSTPSSSSSPPAAVLATATSASSTATATMQSSSLQRSSLMTQTVRHKSVDTSRIGHLAAVQFTEPPPSNSRLNNQFVSPSHQAALAAIKGISALGYNRMIDVAPTQQQVSSHVQIQHSHALRVGLLANDPQQQQQQPWTSSVEQVAATSIQVQKAPMSHNERLKLSSSTPPGHTSHSVHLQHRLSDAATVPPQADCFKMRGSLSSSVRRRLPQYPATSKQLQQQQHQQHAMRQGYQQLEPQGTGVTGLELGPSANLDSTSQQCLRSVSPSPSSMFFTTTKLASMTIGSSNGLEQRSSALMQQEQFGAPGEHELQQQQQQQRQLINQVETNQIDRYRHSLTLVDDNMSGITLSQQQYQQRQELPSLIPPSSHRPSYLMRDIQSIVPDPSSGGLRNRTVSSAAVPVKSTAAPTTTTSVAAAAAISVMPSSIDGEYLGGSEFSNQQTSSDEQLMLLLAQKRRNTSNELDDIEHQQVLLAQTSARGVADPVTLVESSDIYNSNRQMHNTSYQQHIGGHRSSGDTSASGGAEHQAELMYELRGDSDTSSMLLPLLPKTSSHQHQQQLQHQQTATFAGGKHPISRRTSNFTNDPLYVQDNYDERQQHYDRL